MFEAGIEILSNLNPLGIFIISTIVAILVIAFIINVVLNMKYRGYEKDIRKNSTNEDAEFEHRILNKIIEDYKRAGKRHRGDINTQAIIEKNFDSSLRLELLGERFVKASVSLMIILGLVGTFYGLTQSISKLVILLGTDSTVVSEFGDSIVNGLVNSLSGMSVAFITSLFGISSAIIMTLLNIFYNIPDRRINVMVHIEEYLDNILAKSVLDNIIVDADGNVIAVGSSMDKFGDVLETSFKEITDTLSMRLAGVTTELAKTAESINTSVTQFDSSLNEFADSTRDFMEFNHHLKDNIQRMSLSFSDFSEEMKGNTKKIAEGYDKIEDLTNVIRLNKN